MSYGSGTFVSFVHGEGILNSIRTNVPELVGRNDQQFIKESHFNRQGPGLLRCWKGTQGAGAEIKFWELWSHFTALYLIYKGKSMALHSSCKLAKWQEATYSNLENGV